MTTADDQAGDFRRRALVRAGALGLGVGAVALLASRVPLGSVPAEVRDLGAFGPAAAIVAGAALLMALVPRTAISLACGLLFGAVAGAGVALVAAVSAAIATFWLGRWAGRETVRRRLRGRIARLDSWLAQRGTLAVVVVRLLPIAPFGLVGYAYGSSATRFRHYLAGTALGGAPSAFAYAAIGAAVVSPSGVTLLTYLPAVLGALVSASAAVYWRVTSRRP
ncbi:MAG: TVP38/TMEM64 family protein [Hamadaea sp.]|uniref:TVP38/TMEM64 family protein n=1 Tax=Hamadaea sp. NPDC050747 TaxID=3155789 RepID=UPI0017FD89EA|nr:TVP38/TMEM64 family protein [Hamadaea sp.]NUR51948.1 TVP38/TMEM64 family protein [Hamadaea sp.]NUT08655.1 TVP38/TMEM64 family protein [Hamadaea sp.]